MLSGVLGSMSLGARSLGAYRAVGVGMAGPSLGAYSVRVTAESVLRMHGAADVHSCEDREDEGLQH